jgi:hypothetical protein
MYKFLLHDDLDFNLYRTCLRWPCLIWMTLTSIVCAATIVAISILFSFQFLNAFIWVRIISSFCLKCYGVWLIWVLKEELNVPDDVDERPETDMDSEIGPRYSNSRLRALNMSIKPLPPPSVTTHTFANE